MEISFDDLMLYKKCPVKYDMKTCGYITNNKTYNDYLHDLYNYTVAAIYYHKEKAIPPVEKFWEDTYRNNQDIISEKQWLAGVKYFCNIYDYFLFSDMKIIAVNHPYVIEFPEYNVALSGNIPMIANEGNKKQHIIIDPSFSSKMKTDRDLERELKYSIYSKAIRDSYNSTAIIINRNFNLCQENKPVIRNEIHYTRLATVVSNVAKAIENEIYIPNDDYACNNCKLCGICNYWGTTAFKNKNKEDMKARQGMNGFGKKGGKKR